MGQFGVTRLATDKQTQHKYAIKSIPKSHLKPEEAAIIKQELQIMHHVAGVFWTCWDADRAAVSHGSKHHHTLITCAKRQKCLRELLVG